MNKFGIFLIDDMVEHLGFEMCGQNRWNEFFLALTKFALHKNSPLRQATVYGIGMFAINTP